MTHYKLWHVTYLYKCERFIESNTENSWNECINIMSMQGTWCNALFVQAVADFCLASLNRINALETMQGIHVFI